MIRLPTKNVSVGTTAINIYKSTVGYAIDFLLQNLSANNIYFGDNSNLTTVNGTKIIAGGYLSKDNWLGDLWVIADGASSDARLVYQTKPLSIYINEQNVIVVRGARNDP